MAGDTEASGTGSHCENHGSGESLTHVKYGLMYKSAHRNIFLVTTKNCNNPNIHGRKNEKLNCNMSIKYCRAIQ